MSLRLRVISISALFILAIQASAQESHSTAQKSTSPTVTISDQDNGKDIEVSQDATLLVKMTSNPSTGYSWAVKGDPSPLRLEKTKTTKKSKQSGQKVGAPGVQELRFVATSAGMASLTLEYRRPWEYTAPPAKTFSVKVNVR